MPKYTTDDDLELLSELGVDLAPEPSGQRSAREERIIAGFEEIERFVEEQGRLPQQVEEHDIFERLYAVRLDRLRESEECRAILKPLDSSGLLDAESEISEPSENLDDEALLESLGIDAASGNEVTQLTHVRSRQEIKDDLPTGYIYVLRSQSDHPFIVENRSIIHKIGVTVGDVKSRVANAKKDPTYLLADVEIVATFKLANINRKKLEAVLHKVFDSARLELALPDRFDIPVQPREWFLVPVEVIEAVIEKIKAGNIDQFRYDQKTASLTRF
jgi:hypothetical protein